MFPSHDIQANPNLVQEIEKEKKSTELTLAITDTLSTVKATNTTKVTQIKAKRDKLVATAVKTDIETVNQPSSITLDTNNHYTPEVVQQVASANIDVIWSAYEQVKGV